MIRFEQALGVWDGYQCTTTCIFGNPTMQIVGGVYPKGQFPDKPLLVKTFGRNVASGSGEKKVT
ncbi:hypothetical protein [Telmatospirillum sp. J64-1]|uniref:hypothetical protein n=1 Tax=Telmatospirillum sp. J64-1 TaxID=2502183 RepID=UPI00115DBACD|nr:hypothetical protein [Telmatospirillum sp. J64-1]